MDTFSGRVGRNLEAILNTMVTEPKVYRKLHLISTLRNEEGYLLIVVTVIGLILAIIFGYVLPQLHTGQQTRAMNNLNEYRAYEAARKGINAVRMGLKDLDNFQDLISATDGRGILWAIGQLYGSGNYDEYRDEDGDVRFISGSKGIDLLGNEDGKLQIMVFVSRDGVVNESRIGQPVIDSINQYGNPPIDPIVSGKFTRPSIPSSSLTYAFTVVNAGCTIGLGGCDNSINWNDGDSESGFITPDGSPQKIGSFGLWIDFGDDGDNLELDDSFTVTCGDPKDDGWYFYNNGVEGPDGRAWMSLSNWPSGTIPLNRFEYKADDLLRYYDFDAKETLDSTNYKTNADEKYQRNGGQWFLSIGNGGTWREEYGGKQLWNLQKDVSGERPFQKKDNDGDGDIDKDDQVEVFVIVRSTGITVAPGPNYATDKTSLRLVNEANSHLPNPMRQVLEAGFYLVAGGEKMFYFGQAHNLED